MIGKLSDTPDESIWGQARFNYLVIGVDPGPVVGICALYPTVPPSSRYASVALIQADPDTALTVISDLVAAWMNWPHQYTERRVGVRVERFVDGRRSARTTGRHGSKAAKDMIGALAHSGYTGFRERSAAEVKPWASAARLKAAGIEIANPTTMRHALDAGRHALYAAVWDYGWPDPLAHGGRAVRGG